jgi:hypothetical protein
MVVFVDTWVLLVCLGHFITLFSYVSLLLGPYLRGGLLKSLFFIGFLKLGLKTAYLMYKNVFKCTEMYGSVRKWLKKVEIGVACIRNHVDSCETAE